jgi:hypothetical protein
MSEEGEGERIVRLSPEEQASFLKAVSIYIREQVAAAIDERMKEFRHLGAHDEHKQYKFGNMVQRGGSSWHCRVADTKGSIPGESSDWVLISKSGRDGRDANRVPTVTTRRVG